MHSSTRALGIADRITAGLFDPDGVATGAAEPCRDTCRQNPDELRERDVEHGPEFAGRLQAIR